MAVSAASGSGTTCEEGYDVSEEGYGAVEEEVVEEEVEEGQ